MMTLNERIARLQGARKAEQEQRNWLLSVDWSDNGGCAEQAAAHHERLIATYDELIERLKARQ